MAVPQVCRSARDHIQTTLRTHALASASGVAEVSSVGGFVKEYQIDIDPIAMEGFEVTPSDVVKAVKEIT